MGSLPTIAQAGQEVGLGRLRAFGLRMRVRWAKDRLTRELAAGVASTDSRELSLRAGQITAKQTRETIACSIEDLLAQADRPRPILSSQVPIDRRKVRAARELLVELAERLRSAEPVRAGGMALVLLLLTDPEQELYGIATENDLSRAIMEARARLDAPSLDDAP
jgi:hypothetical protein